MKRGIIDVSSILWTCLLAGRDEEFGQTYVVEDEKLTPMRSFEAKRYKEEHPECQVIHVNSASHGYENAINSITKTMDELGLVPRDLILVKEGMNSKAMRQAVHPSYKAGRDKVAPQYEQFTAARDKLLSAFLRVGANVCWQDGGVEADDVIGYLAANLRGDRWIISNDKDLAVMVDPNKGIHQWRMGVRDENPFGDFPHQLITTHIALVGDSSDKIPGAKGFGPKAWIDLYAAFGIDGLYAMDELIRNRQLLRLEEDVAELKLLQKVIDDAPNVYMSYDLARLMIEKVNTARRPLQWQAGMVKSVAECEDERLRKFAGVNTMVHAGNLDKALPWMLKQFSVSPEVALDVETSTPPESDDWVAAMEKAEDRTPVDVLGSTLTSLQLTFGRNMEHTVYLPIDNVEADGVRNLSVAQVRDIVGQVPRSKTTLVHNAQFELPVCYNAWGGDWKDDPEYHGFLRNVQDTAVWASYWNENESAGLKSLSKNVLGYEQQTYQETVRKQYARKVRCTLAPEEALGGALVWSHEVLSDEWSGLGKVIDQGAGDKPEADEPTSYIEDRIITVEHKMNQLTAREVFDYGCDDTICTAAFANHARIIMELEHTWEVCQQVESWTAYVQALGFVQGCNFSLENMAKQEREDDETYEKAWAVLREYLIKIGYEGTVTPQVMTDEEAAFCKDESGELPSHVLVLNPAGIKQAFNIITGSELKTLVRTPSKLVKLIQQWADENEGHVGAHLLAKAISETDYETINQLLQDNYSGEPKIDLASPKQVSALLYDRMKLPVHVTNEITDLERRHNVALDQALKMHREWRRGRIVDLAPSDWELVRKKAKADEDAIKYAIAFDSDKLDADALKALKALGQMKKVMTRRSLFYANYWKLPHWKTKRVHPNIKQCGTVTRRPTSSAPNVYQLPKKGEGKRFRGNFMPHRKKAVVCSIDFSGQELRLAAERSQDANLLACYVGDNLKDMHSLTGSGAMEKKLGREKLRELRERFADQIGTGPLSDYLLMRELLALPEDDPLHVAASEIRKDGKQVNFLAQFGGQALKLSLKATLTVEDAQVFLDARSAMFADVDKAAKRAEERCKVDGYALTMLGARRHLREAILSENPKQASRAARQAWNMEIQGSAAEMTKLAMSRLWTRGVLFRYDMRFFASIYDELAFSVTYDDAPDCIREVHECMTAPYADMKVPIMGSISLGPNFADQIECGDWYIEENVRAAIAKVAEKVAS